MVSPCAPVTARTATVAVSPKPARGALWVGRAARDEQRGILDARFCRTRRHHLLDGTRTVCTRGCAEHGVAFHNGDPIRPYGSRDRDDRARSRPGFRLAAICCRTQ